MLLKSFPNEKTLLLPILFVIFVVGVIGFSFIAYASDTAIPDWVKNNAKWWSEDSISEDDYVQSIEYLIMHGIIDIPLPITEVTVTQTILSEEEQAQSFKVTISNIVKPIPVHFFEKFEMTSTKSTSDPLSKMYDFRDVNPTFFLESLPSADKKQFYKFVSDWMDSGNLNEFDVDIDILDGRGEIIQTWSFTKCEITSYGTYLQDITNFYQFSGKSSSEIRDRTSFSCVGVSLKTP